MSAAAEARTAAATGPARKTGSGGGGGDDGGGGGAGSGPPCSHPSSPPPSDPPPSAPPNYPPSLPSTPSPPPSHFRSHALPLAALSCAPHRSGRVGCGRAGLDRVATMRAPQPPQPPFRRAAPRRLASLFPRCRASIFPPGGPPCRAAVRPA